MSKWNVAKCIRFGINIELIHICFLRENKNNSKVTSDKALFFKADGDAL